MEEVLPEFHRRLSDVLGSLDLDAELVYINDGTLAVLKGTKQDDARIDIVNLSRNFGKERALTARSPSAKISGG